MHFFIVFTSRFMLTNISSFNKQLCACMYQWNIICSFMPISQPLLPTPLFCVCYSCETRTFSSFIVNGKFYQEQIAFEPEFFFFLIAHNTALFFYFYTNPPLMFENITLTLLYILH
ncbi:hypothetical protein GLYMA_06G022200v4 [Glycine max]|uniref:Uncharacterized protein n=1 Tax=Glycine max TaxID=3847 RepID=A0A0R0JH89_SOYBN|nr:hypothetical protein GYH30_013844 [Glycine max]KRH51675.1 hypothetical protein GLYMA_06G022200v4 [Glycine max]